MLNNLKKTLKENSVLKEDRENFKSLIEGEWCSYFEENNEKLDNFIDADTGKDEDEENDTGDGMNTMNIISGLDENLEFWNEEMTEADPDTSTTFEDNEDFEDDAELDDAADMEPATILDSEEDYSDDYEVNQGNDFETDSQLDQEEEYVDKMEEIENVNTLEEALMFLESDALEEEIEENEAETGEEVSDALSDVGSSVYEGSDYVSDKVSDRNISERVSDSQDAIEEAYKLLESDEAEEELLGSDTTSEVRGEIGEVIVQSDKAMPHRKSDYASDYVSDEEAVENVSERISDSQDAIEEAYRLLESDEAEEELLGSERISDVVSDKGLDYVSDEESEGNISERVSDSQDAIEEAYRLLESDEAEEELLGSDVADVDADEMDLEESFLDFI